MPLAVCVHKKFPDSCAKCKIEKIEARLRDADLLAHAVSCYIKKPDSSWNDMCAALLSYNRSSSAQLLLHLRF